MDYKKELHDAWLTKIIFSSPEIEQKINNDFDQFLIFCSVKVTCYSKKILFFIRTHVFSFLEHPVGNSVAGVQLDPGEDGFASGGGRHNGGGIGSDVGSDQGAPPAVETEGGSGGGEVGAGGAEAEVIGDVVDTLGGSESIDVAVASHDTGVSVAGLVLGGVDVVVTVVVVAEFVLAVVLGAGHGGGDGSGGDGKGSGGGVRSGNGSCCGVRGGNGGGNGSCNGSWGVCGVGNGGSVVRSGCGLVSSVTTIGGCWVVRVAGIA